MKNLLKRISLKKGKPLLRQIILANDDLVKLNSKLDELLFSRDNHLYLIKEKSSEIDYFDPRVSLKYMGEITRSILKEFRPYGELRNLFLKSVTP